MNNKLIFSLEALKITRLDVRLREDEKNEAVNQAKRLGLTLSDYIRLLIRLDFSQEILNRIKQ